MTAVIYARYSSDSQREESIDGQLRECKSAIQIRNREMVDRADPIICYIEHKKGGAWQTVDYAMKQGKAVINLSDEHENNSKLFEKSEESH